MNTARASPSRLRFSLRCHGLCQPRHYRKQQGAPSGQGPWSDRPGTLAPCPGADLPALRRGITAPDRPRPASLATAHGRTAPRGRGTRRPDGRLRETRRPAGPQRALHLRQRPQMEALPRHRSDRLTRDVPGRRGQPGPAAPGWLSPVRYSLEEAELAAALEGALARTPRACGRSPGHGCARCCARRTARGRYPAPTGRRAAA